MLKQWKIGGVILFLVVFTLPVSALRAEEPLTLYGWAYAVDEVKEQVQIFEQMYGIPVELNMLPTGPKYNELLVANFIARKTMDVVYCEDLTMLPFTYPGWVIPLPQDIPEIREAIPKYLADMSDFVKEWWYWKGELYGLPYYTGTWNTVYNKEYLDKAGLTVPQTWEDVRQAALRIKAMGLLEHPITLALGLSWVLDLQLNAMVYSDGGNLFDDNLEPVLDKPDSIFQRQLQWLLDAIYDWKIVDPRSLETVESENWRVFATGESFMAMLPSYRMAAITNPEVSKVVENVAAALTPGKTHETIGWSRGYMMTAFTADPARAWKLLEFLGGKDKNGNYTVRKRWMINQGLYGGYKSLWNDPGVRAAFEKRGGFETLMKQSALARAYPTAPWYLTWIYDYREFIHRSLIGELTPAEASKRIAASWEKYKKRFPKFVP